MTIRTIEHNSNDYKQLVQLRIITLLNPIGIPSSYINKEKEQNDTFIAVFENDEIIGCCLLTKIDDKIVQLRQMAVRKDCQGKGIGAAIVEFAEDIAKEKKFKTLILHARDAVIDFYKKCGYEIFDEPFVEVGIGHHKMRKHLMEEEHRKTSFD